MKIRTLCLALSLSLAPACGGEEAELPEDAGTDAGAPDDSCFENPTTHAEIINACTTAQKMIKLPNLPLLNQDGSLPPLPP